MDKDDVIVFAAWIAIVAGMIYLLGCWVAMSWNPMIWPIWLRCIAAVELVVESIVILSLID
jgi:hypothetical protein